MWSYSVNHMLHGAVARIGGAIKRIEGADGAKYSNCENEFKITEMKQLCNILKLTDKEKISIFFS